MVVFKDVAISYKVDVALRASSRRIIQLRQLFPNQSSK